MGEGHVRSFHRARLKCLAIDTHLGSEPSLDESFLVVPSLRFVISSNLTRHEVPVSFAAMSLLRVSKNCRTSGIRSMTLRFKFHGLRGGSFNRKGGTKHFPRARRCGDLLQERRNARASQSFDQTLPLSECIYIRNIYIYI